MTDELKTLKDLNKIKVDRVRFDKNYEGDFYLSTCFSEDDLKAEAVKHWKKHNKEKSKMSQNEMAYWVEVGKLSILEEVFNLTKEDLK